jgi:A/G-specific adenine glycosylase
MTLAPAELAQRLLPWFDAHGRKELPWQRDRTPYRVWISEIMLQQTQVETVKPYFERFTARFPDVAALAAAPLDHVLGLWSGLGYYARARNLHRAAREIVACHGGELPQTLEPLLALPGIGRSTAGAILALAHNRRHPILDGNARRVLARVFLVDEPGWDLAQACTPHARAAAYTQAIMDLGATVCVRAHPACGTCPLRACCGAYAANRVAELPARRRRAPRAQRRAHMVLVLSAGHVFLEQRPPQGIWGGLWAPPEFADEDTARAWATARFGVASGPRRLPVLRHAFTHFDLDIEPWVLALPAPPGRAAEDPGRWHELGALDAVGLPAPVARLLEEITNGEDGALRPARPRSRRPRARAVSG